MNTTKRRQPNSAQVSKTLSQAGHKKAGPYQTFGSRTQGFIVTRHPVLGHVAVLSTGSYGTASEQATASERLTAYAATLTEAGYNVQPKTRLNGTVSALRIERWED